MKKFLALVTLVCMVLTATAALADFPSKTADDLITVAPAETSTGVAVAPDFAITVVAEPTEEIKAEVEEIYNFVAEAPIATYFAEEVQTAIADLGVDASALVGYEAVALAADNYVAEYGDVNTEMTFATVFPEGSEVVVLVKTTDWSVQKCVVENGAVKILLTAEELVFMNENPALVLVLSNEIAQ